MKNVENSQYTYIIHWPKCRWFGTLCSQRTGMNSISWVRLDKQKPLSSTGELVSLLNVFTFWISSLATQDYRQVSNTRRTKSQTLNVFRFVLQLSLSIPLKQGQGVQPWALSKFPDFSLTFPWPFCGLPWPWDILSAFHYCLNTNFGSNLTNHSPKVAIMK